MKKSKARVVHCTGCHRAILVQFRETCVLCGDELEGGHVVRLVQAGLDGWLVAVVCQCGREIEEITLAARQHLIYTEGEGAKA